MGTATAASRPNAPTRSRPNWRNTPATIAITMGIGSAAITGRTQPVRPTARMTSAVTAKAPSTSGQVRWSSEPPTTTVPGMVQKNASGWR